MKLFWWNEQPNLGDLLTPLLFAGAEWASPVKAEWVGIGSVLERFHGSSVTVFGTGRAGSKAPDTDLGNATVLALRGKDTLARTRGAGSPVLGDPGLLVTDLVQPDPQGYTAIVPHYDDQFRMTHRYRSARLVDVTGGPMEAIRTLAGAGRVISSSLHGLVLADAFGIPRKWEWFSGVQASGFKFHDYGTVVGHATPGEWFTANPALVTTVRSELRGCLAQAAA